MNPPDTWHIAVFPTAAFHVFGGRRLRAAVRRDGAIDRALDKNAESGAAPDAGRARRLLLARLFHVGAELARHRPAHSTCRCASAISTASSRRSALITDQALGARGSTISGPPRADGAGVHPADAPPPARIAQLFLGVSGARTPSSPPARSTSSSLNFRPDWRNLGRPSRSACAYLALVVTGPSWFSANYGYIGYPATYLFVPPFVGRTQALAARNHSRCAGGAQH